MKRLILSAALAISSLSAMYAQFSGSGSGTASDPYKIYNPDQLHQVRNYLGQSGVVFQLMSDLDLATWISDNNGSQGWEPIGVESQPFMGVFNGNGKKLTGFSISRSSTDYVGFFGYISGATVKNLTIEGDVAGNNYVGAFVGYGTGDCTLTGLTHNGTITAYSYAGHIVGQYSGFLSDATATGDVSCTEGLAGGIVGYQNTSGKTISNVQMTGDVTCTASNPKNVGGIAGSTAAAISNATFTGDITAKTNTGGICGQTSANVSDVTVNGSVKGSDYTGGIVGNLSGSAAISSARITGAVTGTTLVGGICGKAGEGNLTECFSYCNVTGTGDYVGGVLGQGKADLSKCTSFGKVSGVAYVGGVIGCFGQEQEDEEIPEFCTYRQKEKQISAGYVFSDLFAGYKESITKSITDSYAIGDISATGNFVGGICGYSYPYTSWYKSENNTRTLSASDYLHTREKKGVTTSVIGTFTTYYYYVQFNSLEVNDSYYSGNITGKDDVGGIMGNGINVTLTKNYANANITGKNRVGGIVGNIIVSVAGTNQYYPSDSSTPSMVTDNSYYQPCASELKCNMALNTSVVATADAGRIYDSKGASGVTVATNGATDDNRALETGRLVISGVTQEVADSEKDGVNNGIAYFKHRQNYVSHGWDFNNDWTILDTECFPYKPWQAAPPTVSGDLISGATGISGNSTDGGTVYVSIDQNEEQSADCASDNSWSLTGLAALQSGASVSLYAKVSGKENSYRTQTTVGFPGSGTEADPWRVYSAEDLQGVHKAGYYKQMNDIDLTSWISANSKTAGWVPVGFSGTDPVVYDGGNHKVTGLWVNSTEDYVGLFSSFSKGTIRNLTVEATAEQVKGGNYAGIVIGLIGEGTIENVTANGNVSAKDYVGGVAGYTCGTSLQGLTYSGQLTATGHVGGITSYADLGTITECEATDVVIKASASQQVGGLIGYSSASISRCTATGTITLTGTQSGAYVGGLVGDCGTGKTISECYTNITISSASQNGLTAGLVPYNYGTITRCYTAGSVASTGTGAYAGGLVAKTGSASVIEDCYSTANVSGNQYAAGLVAYNYGTVDRCYASGNIASVYYGAGLIGENDGSAATATNSCALCPKIEVSGESGWGVRVIGNYKNGATEPDMESLFAWKEMQVSVNGTPKTVYDDPLEGTAKTTEQLKQQSTYETLGWDFDEAWTMSADGCPELQWLQSDQPDQPQDLDLADIADGIYFLKNVETGKYLNQGNAWGMHAVLEDGGLPVRLEKQEDSSYTITFTRGSNNWKQLFRSDPEGVFVDYNGQDDGCPYWTITNTGTEGQYHIQTLVGHALYGQAAYPGTYLGNNPGKEASDADGNGLGVYNDVDGNATTGMNITWELMPTEPYTVLQESQLQLLVNLGQQLGLSTAEAEAALGNSATTMEQMDNAINNLYTAIRQRLDNEVDNSLVPLNLTALIHNPSFAEGNADGWEGDEPGFQQFNNAEFYQRTFDIHQTLTGLPDGNYKIEVKGFHRPGSNGSVYSDYCQGTDNAKAQLYANDASKTLANQALYALDTQDLGGESVTYNNQTKWVPNSMADARQWFDNGYYENTLNVTVSGGTLTLGVRLDESVETGWVIFDDFRLTYLGRDEQPQPTVEVTDISQMDNAIYIIPFTTRAGEDASIEICLKNADAATAYVFDMVLPEGITVALNEKGKYIDALSDRHDDHSRTFNYKGGNTYSLSTLSGNSEELTGNDGAIRLLTLSVADDVAEGVYAVEIKNASYSKPDGTLVALPNTTSSVTVEDYVLGDVNGNGGVDIGDAVSIVNYLVGKESSTFVAKAADTNKNGQVDIGDAVTIVNFLVGKTESLSRQTTVWDEKEPQ